MDKKIVVIPVEIWKREIDSRVYLALYLLQHGYRVIIGEMNDIHIRKASYSIVLHKDHAVWSEVLFKRWRANNNEIFAFDEEGLIISNEDYYIKHRVSSWAVKYLSGIFTWGQVQESMIRKKTPSIPLYKVGNLKLELASRLKGDLKDFQSKLDNKVTRILVNTRFPYLNGRYATKESLIHLKILNSDTDLKKFEEFLISERIIRDEFEKFIKLANDYGCNVTLRPHPLEDKDYYIKAFAYMPNVIVDSETDLYVQIQNHEFLVHDGCTTAIEASAMEVSALGLRPEGLSNPYDSTANLFSLNFNSARSLLDYITTNGKKNSSNQRSVELDSLIYRWPNLTSADLIVDVFNKIRITEQPMVVPKRDLRLLLKHFLKYCNVIAFGLLTTIPRINRVLLGLDNIDKKFPTIHKFSVEETIQRVNRVLSPIEKEIDGRPIRIKMLSKKAFLLDV